jgi:hypothetical protein
MSFTRTQYVSNTREMMDAALGSATSNRWTDPFIKTVLGMVGFNEWEGILGANPYYRINQVTLTSGSDGTFPYSSLSTGSGDTAKNLLRIITIDDGSAIVYQQRDFREMPLATVSGQATIAPYPLGYFWYDFGASGQILPIGAVSLRITTNYTPTNIDALSADGIAYDFPTGHEGIIWLMAAAFLLEKGGAEADASNVLRASADAQRQKMMQQLGRRSVRPTFLAFPDSAAVWAG